MMMNIYLVKCVLRRSQWPRGPRRRSVAGRLLRSWVRIPPGAWMFVCCVCCVLSGRGLCYKLITRPEESYRLWCVVVCDLETSRIRRPWPALGRSATARQEVIALPVTIRRYLVLQCQFNLQCDKWFKKPATITTVYPSAGLAASSGLCSDSTTKP